MDPATILAIGGVGASLLGGMSNAQNLPDYEQINKDNIKFQQEQNATQRDFALHLLQLGTPDLSSKEMGDLLYSQGEAAYNKQFQRGLGDTLRNNMRQGSPYSGAQITSDWANTAASERADRRSSSTLQGILGVLPGASTLQTAGNLYGQTQAPQATGQYVPSQTGAGLSSLGYSLGQLSSLFAKSPTGTSTGNTNVGLGR